MKKALFLLTAIFTLIFSANITHAAAKDDAKALGQGLLKKLSSFEQTINAGDIEDIHNQYDAMSNEIKKTERAIGKVSGKSNRDQLNNSYVRPAKIARERVIYEVSQYRLLLIIEKQLNEGQLDKVQSNLEKLERLKKRAVEIKEAGGYKAVPATITNTLTEWESDIESELNTDNPADGWKASFTGEPLFEGNVQNDGDLLYGNYNIVNEVYHADIMSFDEDGTKKDSWTVKDQRVELGGTEEDPRIVTINYTKGTVTSYTTNGQKEWTYSLNSSMDQYEDFYMIGENGTVYLIVKNKINAVSSNGKLLYSIAKPTGEWDMKLGPNGSVYIMNINIDDWTASTLTKYSNTGNEEWTNSLAIDNPEINTINYYELLKVDNNVYVYMIYGGDDYASSIRTLYSFDQNGEKNWESNDIGYVYDLREYGTSTLILTASHFYTLGATGNIQRELEIIPESYGGSSDYIHSSFFSSNNQLYMNTGEYIASITPNGQFSWQSNIPYTEWSALYPLNNKILFTPYDANKAYVYSNNGDKLGTYSLGYTGGYIRLSAENPNTNTIFLTQSEYIESLDQVKTTLHALKY
ncbi:hypothetical protein [Metabacillus endolithicus]|uniref:SbsC C-terminal domain-containing protein n=1 Tax=Metabacillus endolithicus TaxID=1535204 RepID=A0ABW5BZ65_9BACI|nr:hypothetical protein [Metabacillus endolithicus]UPG65404.1 hypothetical protein MVE64_10785 [Metabacillus endolithicus]